MIIKSFRGLLKDDTQDEIRLSTKQGKVGYRIVKFEFIPEKPGATDHRFIMKIYKTPRPESATGVVTVDGDINFSDPSLLAAGDVSDNAASHYPTSTHGIIFDNEIFNQNIFVTCKDLDSSESCNYYLELEVMNLNDNEATVSTLMDIRGS